ncbi:FAD-dependent oxidoreductase [Paenibacillus chondroitinus]|uniref:FAD-dependent oxidoreductase n=1 Tax=Paenibacillus chondroitinus TaxID=59842 RepID=A0ABU6DAG3_9BACL|nr:MULTISPECIES: FAD-dependent oxidoreductase [Paenibacillus]MCY9656811.1 FAD-dependent oxidoreductase [Paenibacillus anseongense]MEB4794461.1 FAD-dependent oxidoreductase [Paenibacillus chondroitinus]
MKIKKESYQVVVCGGGLAGFCAAVAAARQGAKTVLIHDRPVFGGNASSEIRVTPHGAAAFHAYGRETGIISELLIEERARNHEHIGENGRTNSVSDMVMYDMAVRTNHLTFYLNTSVLHVEKSDDRTIKSIKANVANAETELHIEGDIFIDCTGDAIVADKAGCEWRWGSESFDEFREPHAPAEESSDTMGNSIHFRAVDMGRPVPFEAPEWAVKHENPDYFYKQGRHFYDLESGFWWIEIGVPWNTIYDNETIRHELTRHTLGIWDWMKNIDPDIKQKAANYALDWIGQVPAKRESRRVIGQYFMTEHDPANNTIFPDEVAYGGWFIDLHTPGGLLAPTAEPASAEGYPETSEYARKSYCGPYGIPFRMLVAKDVDNLMMAGRNVSVTHAALGTVRVMATTALMGQAVGVGAAIALEKQIAVPDIYKDAIRDVQQTLLRDGCFLPNIRNEDKSDLARLAQVSASSSALVYGAGPETEDRTYGLRNEKEKTRRANLAEPLTHRRGQWIAIGSGNMDLLSVCLSNSTKEEQTVKAYLVEVNHIWDYRTEPGQPLAEADLTVPANSQCVWVDWPLQLAHIRKKGYVRLDLDINPNVEWHSASTVIPGHTAAYDMGEGRMRRYMQDGGTLSFKVSPPQEAYPPGQVISGVTRPHQSTNIWRSDPNQPLAQWLALKWESPQTISEVHLTFPGHLLRELHNYAPLYRDPQCPKQYDVQALINDVWVTVARKEGNYQRLQKHVLDQPVRTSQIRIVVEATNGDASAAIYEVRCYA